MKRAASLLVLAVALAACERAAPPATVAPAEPTVAPSFASLALPATFQGVLPCADCEGIEHTLTLRPDGSYWYGLRYLGQLERDAGALRDVGRWVVAGTPERLELRHGRRPVAAWALVDAATLRKLAGDGGPIVSELDHAIRRLPTPHSTFGEVRMRGLFRYMADAASFESCETGTRLAVVGGPAYLELERAYLAASVPGGEPRLAVFSGALDEKPADEEGMPVRVAVTRFESVSDRAACPESAP